MFMVIPLTVSADFFFINGYIYFCTQFDLMWSSVWWEVYKKQYHVVKYIVYGEVYSKWSRDQVYAKEYSKWSPYIIYMVRCTKW